MSALMLLAFVPGLFQGLSELLLAILQMFTGGTSA